MTAGPDRETRRSERSWHGRRRPGPAPFLRRPHGTGASAALRRSLQVRVQLRWSQRHVRVVTIPAMDDQRAGAAFRALRLRARRTQAEIAAAAGVSHATISRVERGHATTLPLRTLRLIAAAVDARVELQIRWRGGELDRLLDERHALLQAQVLARLERTGWTAFPETSFSVYGERGAIDVLAWHAASRALLVVEVKSQLVDCQDLLRTMDQRRRLASRIGRERGLDAKLISSWVVLEASDANRRRAGRARALLSAAFPDDGMVVRRWLAAPRDPVRALSFVDISHAGSTTRRLAPIQRVRRPSERSSGRAGEAART